MSKEIENRWWEGLTMDEVIRAINSAPQLIWWARKGVLNDKLMEITREFMTCEFAVICAMRKHSLGRLFSTRLSQIKYFIDELKSKGVDADKDVCLLCLPVIARTIGIGVEEKS